MSTSKPKVLIVGPGYPYRNGPAIYLSHLCSQLSAEFDVELVNYTMLYPGFLFPGKTQYDDSKQTISYPNKRMVSSLNPLTWAKTAAYINQQNPDIIAFDWWHPFFGPCHAGIIALLSKRNKKRILYITENVISHEANKADKVLTKLALNKSKAFLALSNSVEKHLQTMFSQRVFRSELPIYDFYSTTDAAEKTADIKKSFGFAEDDTVFLFFGLVRKYKGLDLLLDAFANVAAQNSKVKLLVVGEFYEDAQPYYDIVKKRGIENYVVIENRYVPNEEVEKFFLACDVTVLPYRSATQSGVLNVAYGFYKPAIVTNVGELGSLVSPSETGIVVDQPTVADIQNGLEEFLQMKASGRQFAASIKNYIEEKNTFKQVAGVFKNIVTYFNN